MTDTTGVHVFEQYRAMLMGLAYRMLGSRADAEDAVQDTFVKWQNANQAGIDNPTGWLTTICTRRCIDMLRSAHRTRVEYVGTWLPEPIQMPSIDLAETKDELAPSLATAFLLMLERLTPKERGAYLLHEIFDVSYGDVARILGIQESTCRKLVSRARQNIEHATVRHVTPVERQEQLLAAFEAAVTSGHIGLLATMLSDEIELCADGGGKVEALLDVLRGKVAVERFITENLHEYWEDHDWVPLDINGHRGFILRRGGTITAAISFAYDDTGHATNIYIMRNPDKLSALVAPAPAHA